MNQPDRAVYGIEELFLFPRFTRASYKEATGKQATPWDKAQQIKRWADPAGAGAYTFYDPVRLMFSKFSLTVEQSKALNLPGVYDYPKGKPAPTPAMVSDNISSQPMNPEVLCSEEQARALAAELGAAGFTVSSVVEQNVPGAQWNGETRRQWILTIGEQQHSAALLIGRQNMQGVGAPGHWFGTNASGPMWTPDRQDTGEQDMRPEIPIPCRGLLPNEKLHFSQFGTMVFRTDMESEYNPKPPDVPVPAPGGGGLTADQDKRLTRIDLAVQEILSRGAA